MNRRRSNPVMKLALCGLCLWTVALRGDEIPKADKPEDVGLSSAGLKKIHEMMQGHIDAGRIQGGVTVVARHGKVAHFEAHGLMDVANKKPMTKDAVFVMMSSTKPVAAVATLMMLDEGKLKLDDPVAKYIPEFKNSKVAVRKGGETANGRGSAGDFEIVPASHDITIKDLLTHTSGLMSGGVGSQAPGGRVQGARDTLANYIPKVGAVPLDFQPGTRWAYSATTGPDVLGRIVEITSSQSFDEFLAKRLFEPLGMKDTFFNLPDDRRARRVVRSGGGAGRGAPARGAGATAAEGTTNNGAATSNGAATNTAAAANSGAADGGTATATASPPATANTPATGRGTRFFSGGAGLSSTAEDYLRFEQMLVHKGELFGKRILKSETVALMSSNQVGDLYSGLQRGENGMGFGFLVSVTVDAEKAKSGRANGSFGWGGAYGTMSWTDPKEDMTCVIMLQQRVQQVQKDFEMAVKASIAGP